ncbi:hypothetical protein C8F01DRAFT_1084219 [Mycena amicta]|nr:hypothetical protein C8F01DRAFT_1084219 [Mycena amicta]
MFSAAALVVAAAIASVRAADFPAGVIGTGMEALMNSTCNLHSGQAQWASLTRPRPRWGPLSTSNPTRDFFRSMRLTTFCLFAPPEPNSVIGDTEGEEVAWCVKPRNNARVIPDGTITGVSFLKTPFYVQILGTGDLTKLNIKKGDSGGELDPHGQFGAGNPVGGNVTTNIVDGTDINIGEWMLFISDTQFCVRACTNANATYDAAHMCWHQLDVMGCEFVMPGTYNPPGTFETCDADVAYPPGWYPTIDAAGKTSFSTFAQFFTGVYTGGDGKPTAYTVGDLVTPSTVAFIPSSSNCVATPTIANGIALASLGVTGSAPTGGASSSGTGSQTTSGASSSGTESGSSAGSSPTSTNSGSAAFPMARVGGTGLEFLGIALVSLVAGVSAVGLLH